jgi:hypothetical protein
VLTTEGVSSYDQQATAEALNNHFSSIVDIVNNKNAYKTRTNKGIFATPYNYLLQNCLNTFPSAVFKSFSTKDITNIIM